MIENSESSLSCLKLIWENKTDVVYEEDLSIFVVVYSLKSCHNDISTNIMDEVYSINC